jgi:predicted nucleotidyltransferase component of viral defense system
MPKILTPLQEKFLHVFFQLEVSKEFFLTGETALSEYHLQHRYSEDMDLFTISEEAFRTIDNHIPELLRSLQLQVVNHRRIGDFSGYILQGANTDERLKVDLVRDIGVQFGTKKKVGAVIIDNLENIAANKIGAILGRTEVKDFVDIYFLIQEKHATLEKAIVMGKEKDLGVEKFILAGLFRQADDFKVLPRMIKPLTLETLSRFYEDLSNQLLDQIKPV